MKYLFRLTFFAFLFSVFSFLLSAQENRLTGTWRFNDGWHNVDYVFGDNNSFELFYNNMLYKRGTYSIDGNRIVLNTRFINGECVNFIFERHRISDIRFQNALMPYNDFNNTYTRLMRQAYARSNYITTSEANRYIQNDIANFFPHIERLYHIWNGEILVLNHFNLMEKYRERIPFTRVVLSNE